MYDCERMLVSSEADDFGIFLIYVFLTALIIVAPINISIWIILWFSLGIAVFMARIFLGIKKESTSFTRELFFAIKMPDHGLPSLLLFWPIELFSFIFLSEYSLKNEFRRQSASKIKQAPESWGMHWETAHEIAERATKEVIRESCIIDEKIILTAKSAKTTGVFAYRYGILTAAFTGIMQAPLKAQQLTPPIAVGTGSLDIYGWSKGDFTAQKNGKPKYLWSTFRVRACGKGIAGMDFFTDFELRRINDVKSDWLKSLWLSAGDNFKFRAGRFLTAAGTTMLPPFLLETIKYPRFPYATIAYGFQAETILKQKYSLMFDLTGPSNKSFTKGSIRRPEFSARAVRRDSWHNIGGSIQVSSDFYRFGVDFSSGALKMIYFKCALYAFQETGKPDGIGWYSFTAFRPADWFEFHSQADHRLESSKNSLILTNGISCSTPKKNFRFILEHEASYGLVVDFSRVLSQLQLRF